MSTFVWLDYSECERRKLLDIVDLFRITASIVSIHLNRHPQLDAVIRRVHQILLRPKITLGRLD
jgi:hypothetical protein